MAWDKGQPEPGIKAKLLDDLVRTNNTALEAAIDQDHDFVTSGTQSGKHKTITMLEQTTPGASPADSGYLATVDSGTQPELEFTSEDGSAVTLTSDGSMGSASTDISVNDATVAGVLNVTGATGIDGNFDINTNKFTVDTDGNTVVAGTLDANISLKLATGATVTEFSIDDTLGGDSDTAVPTEKSVKTYVDASSADGFTPSPEVADSDSKNTTIFPNGLKIGSGSQSISANAKEIVTPDRTFSKIYSVVATIEDDTTTDYNEIKIASISDSTFEIRNSNATTLKVQWICIGR